MDTSTDYWLCKLFFFSVFLCGPIFLGRLCNSGLPSQMMVRAMLTLCAHALAMCVQICCCNGWNWRQLLSCWALRCLQYVETDENHSGVLPVFHFCSFIFLYSVASDWSVDVKSSNIFTQRPLFSTWPREGLGEAQHYGNSAPKFFAITGNLIHEPGCPIGFFSFAGMSYICMIVWFIWALFGGCMCTMEENSFSAWL